MEFLSRVDLISSTGRWLAKVSSDRARFLLIRNAKVEDRRSGKVSSIKLLEVAKPIKPSTPLTLAAYLGQRYVFSGALKSDDGQVVARCYELKDIDPDDSGLFGLGGLADRLRPPLHMFANPSEGK